MNDISKLLDSVLEEESDAFAAIPRTMYEAHAHGRLIFRSEDFEMAKKVALHYNGKIRTVESTEEVLLTVPVKRKEVLTKNDTVPEGITSVQLAPFCTRVNGVSRGIDALTSDHAYSVDGSLYSLKYIKLPAGSSLNNWISNSCTIEMDDFDGMDKFYLKLAKMIIVHKVTDTAVWYELSQLMGANLVCKTPDNIKVIDGSTYIHDEAGMHLLKGVPDKDGLLTIAEGCVSVREGACESNLNVKKVICPSTLKTVGKNAFYNSGVKDVVFNEGLEVLENRAFNTRCVMNAVVLPSTLKRIHFNGLNCIETTVPEGCVIDNYSITHNATVTITDKQAADMFFAEYMRFRRKAI